MAVFGWIGHSELQRKIPGGINFAFLFSGGLKKCFYKFRGALFIALFLSGGLFQIKDGFGAQQKKMISNQELGVKVFFFSKIKPMQFCPKFVLKSSVKIWPLWNQHQHGD